VEHADRHLGPFRAFDLPGRLGAALAGDRVAADGDDRVSWHDPGSVGRRAGEYLDRPQAALDRDDAEADAGEAPFDLLVEAFPAFRREVFGEAVPVAPAQGANHPLQRGVAEFGAAYGTVVVVLDHFRGFGREAAGPAG